MVSSTYCDNLKERLIWGSSIQKNQSNDCLDMQMQGIFQTHTKLDPKPGMYLVVMVLLLMEICQANNGSHVIKSFRDLGLA